MAYVRKTDILVDAIKTNVRTMSATAQEPYANDTLKTGTPVYDALRKAVVDKTWEAAPNTQGTLPDEWCGTPRRVDVHLNNSDGNRMKSFVVEANEVDPIVLSPQYANASYPDVYINYADLSGASRDWAYEVRATYQGRAPYQCARPKHRRRRTGRSSNHASHGYSQQRFLTTTTTSLYT